MLLVLFGDECSEFGPELAHHRRFQRIDQRYVESCHCRRGRRLRPEETRPDDHEALPAHQVTAERQRVVERLQDVHTREVMPEGQTARRHTRCDDEPIERLSRAVG